MCVIIINNNRVTIIQTSNLGMYSITYKYTIKFNITETKYFVVVFIICAINDNFHKPCDEKNLHCLNNLPQLTFLPSRQSFLNDAVQFFSQRTEHDWNLTWNGNIISIYNGSWLNCWNVKNEKYINAFWKRIWKCEFFYFSSRFRYHSNDLGNDNRMTS